ncbi:MAG: TonB-dependent receptor [Acidobacteria bacterium]|nr:TonB-dependent receptor [Acidobacteriota bacterium]
MKRMFRKAGFVHALLIVVALASGVALGQGIVTGSISGTLSDPQSAVVPGATVRATQLETNRVFTSTSSGAGVFQLSSLPPGHYNVVIESKGFSNHTAGNVEVVVGKDTSLGAITLNVGASTETVTVQESAPLIESTSDQISQTFENKQVADVPLGNGYDSFVLFAPGVATAGSGGFSNNNGAELSINGQRARSNNYQLDGQNNNDNTIGGPSIFFGNQDTVAELQVIQNFDAEYGRNIGGVVNYITKAGTNAFHGTAYEFWQGDRFDSLQNQEKNPLLGFCSPGQTPATAGCKQAIVPRYVQNQWGGTIGGPLKRDKVWFFASSNFQRNRAAGAPFSSSASLTPTTTGIQQLQAAFPSSPAVTELAQFGPATVKLGNPTFSNIQNVNVTANGITVPIQMGTLTRLLSQPFNDYEATGRVDTQITNKDRFYGRYIFQQNVFTNQTFFGPAPIAQGQIVNVPGRSQQIGLDLTHTFTPEFLNQVRFSYSRSRSAFEGGAFGNCVLATIGSCSPDITILDPTVLGVGQSFAFPQGRIINVYQLQDNASMVHGKHVMKWGGEYQRQRSPNYGLFEINGVLTYQDFNSFIANTPLQTQVAYGQPVLSFKENDFALYFQDDWRAKENLTVNLGLRWEFFQQASNLLHDESVAQQTGPHALWDKALPLGLTTVPKLPNHYRNFGPVIGFAWTPRILPGLFGNDKTVIRGGFRIAYEFAYYNLATNVQGTSPFTNLATIPTASGSGAAGLPNLSNLDGANIASALFPLAPKGNPGFATELQFGNNFRNPYSQQWNLGVQRQIAGKIAAELRYVGNHDIGNFQEINGNPDVLPLINNGFANLIPPGLRPCTTPNTPGTTGTDQFGNPVGYANCNFSRVIKYANTGYSIYHGLQSQLRLQNWHGFTGQASYTFSKTIDNASEAFSTGAGTVFALAQNPFDISRAERAVSNYDFPHVFGLLWVYDLPFRDTQKGFLGHLIGGWEINGTYRYTSGQPWTVEQNAGQGLCDPANFTGGALDTCRPILNSASAPFNAVGQCMNPAAPDCGIVSVNNGGSPIALSQVHWIINDVNAAKFFGSPFLGVGRNTERGQPISTVNFAVFKNTRVTERLTLQFQAEAFNLLNQQWLGIPIQNVNNAANVVNGVNQFGSLAFNNNGGDTFAGNIITDGIGRRRLQFGAKLIF